MEAITLNFQQSLCGTDSFGFSSIIQFSLKPFIEFLKVKCSTEKTSKLKFYNYMLEQFSVYPELEFPIPDGDISNYNHLLDLIYSALSPLITDESEQLWALGKPISPCFYYGTTAFYDILLNEDGKLKSNLSLPSIEKLEANQLSNFYTVVLKKFYNLNLGGNQNTIKAVVDHDTRLLKYYRIETDNRFLDIHVKGELPEITLKQIQEYYKDDEGIVEVLQDLIPPETFNIQGFSVVTLYDMTAEYALEAIKNAIVTHNPALPGWNIPDIINALKSLVGNANVEFNLLPYIKLNRKSVLYNHKGFESIIIQTAKESGMSEESYQQLTEGFTSNPQRLIFPDLTQVSTIDFPLATQMIAAGLKAYGLFPLYYNTILVGCLEVYTNEPLVFNGSTISTLRTAFPLLAQLYQNMITDFNNEIISIVTDKFTALQPAVQWRFNEVAYNYLKSGAAEKNLVIESVYFKAVQPFYGAVDIKNSSVMHNLMIRKDLQAHFQLLDETFQQLKSLIPEDALNDFPEQRMRWAEKNFDLIADREIMKIDDYLQRQLPQFFNKIIVRHPESNDLIESYFELTKPGAKIYNRRDSYELSMQMINHAVNQHLDQFNATLQEIYPCYFEKFRTDGVEFDIYLGQSLTPGIKFNAAYVSDFRLRQLRVIAEITQLTASLVPHLPIALETTQLIFVYDHLIDISFRMDEQRFDVEGSYNIRYQMVKKRIDKAYVRNTEERITQPNKIAIVYFNVAEVQEYLGYINRLQEEGLLSERIEYLDVEELQGVEGLKVMRVELNQINAV